MKKSLLLVILICFCFFPQVVLADAIFSGPGKIFLKNGNVTDFDKLTFYEKQCGYKKCAGKLSVKNKETGATVQIKADEITKMILDDFPEIMVVLKSGAVGVFRTFTEVEEYYALRGIEFYNDFGENWIEPENISRIEISEANESKDSESKEVSVTPVEGPSREETIEYIKQKLNIQDRINIGCGISRDNTTTYKQEVEFEGCDMVLTLALRKTASGGSSDYARWRGYDKENIGTFRIKLTDIEEITCREYLVLEMCFGRVSQIPLVKINTGRKVNYSGSTRNISWKEGPCFFAFDSDVDRVIKALNHLIKICGGSVNKDVGSFFE